MELFVGLYAGVGIGGGDAIVVTGCSGCAFIWKKAIAINSAAIHMRRIPMRTIVRIAPINSSSAAVENKPRALQCIYRKGQRHGWKTTILIR
jgi:hypothetical protein